MNQTSLVIVDVQNDFCPGGALAVTDGDAVVPVINDLIGLGHQRGWQIIASKDDHSIKSQHFDINGGPWPVHCVSGTYGAQFHPNLDVAGAAVVLKGVRDDDDGYSPFSGRMAGSNKPLHTYLQRHRIKRLVFVGLTTEYCVTAGVLDGLTCGYEVFVVIDAIRPVNLKPEDGRDALAAMVAAGATLITSAQVAQWRDE